MSINKEGEIVSTACNSPRGLDVCHHMAALLLNAHYNIGATDKPREWGNVTRSEEDEVKTVDEMFPAQTTYTAIENLDEVDVKRFKEILGDMLLAFRGY